MSRYPRQEGLAVPVQNLGYEIVPHKRGSTTNHHLYYNRASYQGIPIRHQFRNLVDHVVTMENAPHQELHYRFTPPVIPRTELMIDVLDEYMALNGVLNCVREKKTNEIYQIQPDHWQVLRDTFKG
jgi:predicted protein tyrosine phosphatase